MATKDEENTANTVPCSVILTAEKIYVCHDEQDNALIRQLESIKLEYIARLLIDSTCPYYCVLVSVMIFSWKSSIYFFYCSRLKIPVKVRNLGFSTFCLLKK